MATEEIRQPLADNTPSSDEEDNVKTCSSVLKKCYDWNEIVKHNTEKDAWVVIEDKVYEVTKWAPRHPGGKDIVLTFAGQDATEAFTALHPDLPMVRKYMNPWYIGDLKDEGDEKSKPQFNKALLDDFHQLKDNLRKAGLYKANKWFFFGWLLHIWAVEVLAYWIICTYGTGWIPFLVAGFLLGGAQMQAGWLQHDFGHESVFENPKWNRWMHYLTLSHQKGASKDWWNWRHFMHHSKPNVIHKDPDIKMIYIFVIGKRLSALWGKKRLGIMPYSLQHYYWHFIGPPLLIPFYFQYEHLTWAFKNKRWVDLFWVSTFYMKLIALYYPLMGGWNLVWFYLLFRVVESHWFVYVTQMNHLPKHIDFDYQADWPTLQNMTTCNVEGGWFNNWFTGHLNYQVEHHLFPTMPRHNYPQAHELVKSLFKKHGLQIEMKTLPRALYDVVGCLKEYGNIWYQAYYHI